MLYDPKWEVQTKPDVFSLESLIAWLEKMPADRSYYYGECDNCMLAQYFAAMGYQNVGLDAILMRHSDGEIPLPADFNDIAIDAYGRFNRPDDYRWTFGAALERARAAL